MTEYPTGTALVGHIPDMANAELVQAGGQKGVYRARIKGQTVALKLIALAPEETMSASSDGGTSTEIDADISAVVGRVKREVAILEQADVPVLSKRGPLGLSRIRIGDDRWLYFTEEWIEGESLLDMIRRGRLPPAQVSRLGVDLIQATCWLSGQGLVHRDIKPANVMWANDRSRFVLLDPGIALDLHGPSLTLAPVTVGTMAYLSPEQMDASRKRALDFRSDLFAIGIVLYEAAVAEHPFMSVGTTPTQVLAGILSRTPQPVAVRVQGFPLELSNLVARLLGKAPHLRYRTCDRARAAIEHVAASMGVKV